MATTTSFVTSVLVTAMLAAVPAAAGAQATRRGGGSSGGSGCDSGSGGTTRSAPSGPSTSEPSRVAVPRASSDRPAPSEAPRTPSARRESDDGNSPTPPSRPAGSVGRARPGSAATTGARVGDGDGSFATRTRGSQGLNGYAQARDFSRGGSSSFGRWVYSYPWYSSRYGWASARYSSWYDPYYYSPYSYGYYGYGRYGYSPYGYGYSPYGYDPYGHFYGAQMWGSPYASGYRDDDEADEDDGNERGAIRIRGNPREAKVYIDGALAGIVDDFDGLSNHLTLPAGKHHLEIRADGYEPYATEIDVEAGRTRTERANLKRRE